MLSALNVDDEVVSLKLLDVSHFLVFSEKIVKLLLDNLKFGLDFLSEALFLGSLLSVELLLKNLAVGANLRLRDVFDLLNLIECFHVELFGLDWMVGVRLAAHCPSKEGTVTSCSVEG